MRGCQAHEVPVPAAFEEPEVVKNMEKAIVEEWFSGYISKQLGRLSMGRLIGELSERFDSCVADETIAPKVGLYACHDTTLAGALKVLQCYDNRWPFFTAFLSFELFKKQESSSPFSWLMAPFSSSASDKEHYVRVKYNTNDMHLPACAPAGKHLPGSEGAVCTCESYTAYVVNRFDGPAS